MRKYGFKEVTEAAGIRFTAIRQRRGLSKEQAGEIRTGFQQ